ncbi:MAG: hypothetical protein AAGJ88_16980, partial [Pseudomonadota bacterium]
ITQFRAVWFSVRITQQSHKQFQIIDDSEINDDTVVHAMCCEYKANVESALESLSRDIDRVLWLDAYPNTLRYQVTY